MKLGVVEPRRLVDVSRLPHDAIEDTAGGGLRIGAAVRNADLAAHPAVMRALPRALPGAARRRVRPAAQPRHRRRQPAPAHALLLLPGRLQALQQAPARLRLPGARGRPPQPRDPRALRALRRHAPVRHGGRARRHRGERARPRRQRRAHDPAPRPAPPARRQAAARHGAQPRRPDHRGRARRARAALRLPQGPRPRVLLVRGVLRRRDRRRRATARSARPASPSAGWRTCRGGPSAPRPPCAARPPPPRASPPPPTPSSTRAQPLRDNAFKVPLARNVLVRALAELCA